MESTVGVIGLGIMGGAMAYNLLKNRFQIVGYDPSAAAVQRLVDAGGQGAASITNLVESAEILFTSLPTAVSFLSAVKEVAIARPKGRVLVELSTLPLPVKQRAAEDIALEGCTMLDCPVSGTGAQAISRDLTVFASGDEDAFKKSEAAINGMSRQVLYLGKFGNGSTMKFIANHLVTIHNTAVAEALILAEKAGLDVSVVYEALRDSAATSRMFQIRGPLIVEKRYTNPSMRISTYMKDLDIINEFASGLRCPTPLFNVCAQLYYAAQSSGYGELDTAGVAKVLESMAGLGLGQGHPEIN